MGEKLLTLSEAMEAHRQGDLDRAKAAYQAMLEQNPDNPDALHLSGLIAHQQGDHKTAIQRIGRAIEINPFVAAVHNNLGEAWRESGDFVRALACYQQATSLDPVYVPAWFNSGLAYQSLQQNSSASTAFRHAVNLDPAHLRAWRALAISYREQRQFEDVVSACEQLLKLSPDEADAWISLSDALLGLGRIKEAEAACGNALKLHPLSGGARLLRAKLRNYSDCAHDDIADTIRLLERPDLGGHDRSQAAFAAAKMFDDCGSFERAFDFYQQANAGKTVAAERAGDEQARGVEATIDLFSPEYLQQRSGWGLTSEQPVFIVGMPRSGTTLVEQILSMHSQMSSRGELKTLHRIISQQGRTWSVFAHHADTVNDVATRQIRQMADQYLAETTRDEPGVRRVTDKMPSNSRYVGMMRLMFPHAHVIYCRRDPRDTCLSNYFQPFGDGNEQSSDLFQLGRYYSAQEQLMDHWLGLLPNDFIQTVDYEKLVADPDHQIKKLLTFLGLPYEQDCLNFHRSKSAVHTASALQVREPIYQRSVARWEHYKDHLEPLFRGLQQN